MELKKGEALKLPDWLRPALADPFGKTLSEEETISELKDSKAYIITVGDETTKTLLRHKIEPDLAIFDLKTKRSETTDTILQKHYKTKSKVKNPQKMITYDLWVAIEQALKKRKEGISVDGEEDLAALPCIFFAEPGSIMLYGIPDVGISLVLINKSVKTKAENLMNQMELISDYEKSK